MSFFEGFIFLLIVVIVSFCLGDEEPVLDLSDLGFVHVGLLVISLLSIVFDNYSKANNGQYGAADRQTLTYGVFKVNSLVWYFMVIWLGFFVHTSTPLLVDSVESANL